MQILVFYLFLFCVLLNSAEACESILMTSGATFILNHLEKPQGIPLSDLRKALLRISEKEKVKLKLSTKSFPEVTIEIPSPNIYSKEIVNSWLRYHVTATYARAMALGNPGESIFVEIDEQVIDKATFGNDLLHQLRSYFTDHKESLSKKASPETGVVVFALKDKLKDSPEKVPQESNVVNEDISEKVVIGFDQGARGVSAAVYKGKENFTQQVLGTDSEELRQENQSLNYSYTFEYGTAGGSGEEFSLRLIQFVKRVLKKTQAELGNVEALFIGMPGVKATSGDFVSLGQIARSFGDPKTQPDQYQDNMKMANMLLLNFKHELNEQGIKIEFANDMIPWAYSIAAQGIDSAVAVVAGGGQGQIAIQNGQPVFGNFEGGHQVYWPLMEEGFDYNASSPPGSFESLGLGNPGILQHALKSSGLSSHIKNEFLFSPNENIEVIHLGLLWGGINPKTREPLNDNQFELKALVEEKVWHPIAAAEAEHILFLHLYGGQTHFVFSGGPVSGNTGPLFFNLLNKILLQKISEEELDLPELNIELVKEANPADRAAMAALSL